MAGPATTGDTYVFNSMPQEVLPTPSSTTVEPGETLKVRLELNMHGVSMGGPHLFRVQLSVAQEGQGPQPPVEVFVRAHFG